MSLINYNTQVTLYRKSSGRDEEGKHTYEDGVQLGSITANWSNLEQKQNFGKEGVDVLIVIFEGSVSVKKEDRIAIEDNGETVYHDVERVQFIKDENGTVLNTRVTC